MIWHSSPIESVITELKTNLQTGLSSQDAQARLDKINSKRKKTKQKTSYLSALLKEIKSATYIFMLIMAVVAIVFHLIFNEFSITEAVVIMALTIIKAILTAFVKWHYLYDIDKMKSAEKSTVTVLRNGKSMKIDSDKVVPGDIIYVTEGDYVPADARLIKITELHCDEYNITGETVPTQKNTSALLQDISPIEERENMIFAGSHILSGSGVAVVTEIGDYTEYGKKTIETKEDNGFMLPLETRLSQLGRLLDIGLVVVSMILFILGLIVNLVNENTFLNSLFNSIFSATALLMTFLPSLITLIATASISRGIRRMKASGISIFDPKSIDKIAKLDVICADKTGSFTQSKMVLTQMFDGFNLVNVKTEPVSGEFNFLLRIAALCCDGEVKLANGRRIESGDSTQTAIIAASMELLGLSKYDLDNIYPRMAELPFNPDRKLMTTVNLIDGSTYAIVRGSVEALSEKCSGDIQPFLKAANEMSEKNLRAVGVAIKPIDEYSPDLSPDELECNLNFVGILGLADMPRLDSKKAVKACQKAGMKVIMFTGDHPSAAFATAQKIRIANSEEQVVSGEQISQMSDEELLTSIEKYTVFARVTADDRCRIVEALKDNGHIVATTGDSAQNTASLRLADIGYSLGKTGSDVAICSSEVVIEDDSFSTVVESVRDCRGIFHNISKASKFFLASAFGMIFSILLGYLIFGTAPTSAAIILLSILSASLMPLGMVYEKSENKDINLTIDNDANIFNSKYLADVIFNGAIFAITYLVAHSIGASMESVIDGTSASNFAIITTAITHWLSAIMLRNENTFISFDFSNKRIFIFAGAGFVTLLVLSLIFFNIGILNWFICLLIALISTFVLNCIKVIRAN